MAAARASARTRFFSEMLRGDMKWYHWAGAGVAVCGMNVGVLVAMGQGYKSYYADYDRGVESFTKRYGLPSEKQRLDIFRIMAPVWDDTIGQVENGSATKHRLELFGNGEVRGNVLEVAVGTGRCFEAISQGITRRAESEAEKEPVIKGYLGVDCLEEMLDCARGKLADLPFPAAVQRADAHRLPFEDGSFDTVIGSLCLCSMERPAEALAEMARVCRSGAEGGRVLILEPGLAQNPLTRFAQRFLGIVPNPKHAWESGWYDDLEPAQLIAACPRLELRGMKIRAMGNWYLITAAPCEE